VSALKHRVTDLRWGLWCGRLDWEPLRVLETCCLRWGEWSVTVRTLATSHSVSLETPAGTVHELITCMAPPSGSIALLDKPGHVSVEVLDVVWESSIALGALDQIPEGQPRLESVFPGGHGARTVVVCREEADDLVIESFHGYPEEDMALIGRSRVRRRSGRWDD
jgi:hypothetical protein